MLKSEAQSSTKSLNTELFSLNPSSLIVLFEINIADIAFNTNTLTGSEANSENNTIFRFHNCINLTSRSIFWRGKEYIAAPITAEGFETTVRGSPTAPKLAMSVPDEGIATLSRLKDQIFEMGDIVGAKLTRIRTFSKFIDAVNFINSTPPPNFYPDPNQELPRDIYYIDRKSLENKNTIEYELSPLFELEGIKLPGRIVSANNCTARYRGEGCLYEYSSRKNEDIHGDGNLPSNAPPVATAFDEKISTLITGVPFTDKGEFNDGEVYNKGDFVFLRQRGLNYYFVSKVNDNSYAPPNSLYWVHDDCSHKCQGCKLRWSTIGDGVLPFGGFPSAIRFR